MTKFRLVIGTLFLCLICQGAMAMGPIPGEVTVGHLQEFEQTFNIEGARRYTQIVVLDGYEATKNALILLSKGKKVAELKDIHGTLYAVVEILGEVPEALLQDKDLQLKGMLINRSSETKMTDMIHAVYEFKTLDGSYLFGICFQKAQ